MERNLEQQRQQAHSLLDGLTAEKLLAVHNLLEVLSERNTDALSQSLANAPWEDEEIGEEEARAVAKSSAWLAANPGKGIPHEEILAEFGLTIEDFDRMDRASLQVHPAAL